MHVLSFEDFFEEPNGLIPQIRRRTEKKKDVWILISGAYGDGKSTLAGQLCKGFDKTFTLKGRSVYSLPMFARSIRKYPGKAINVDELKRFGKVMDFSTREGKIFEEIGSEARQYRELITLNVGEAIGALKWLIRYRALLWGQIIQPGVVMMFQRRKIGGFGIQKLEFERAWDNGAQAFIKYLKNLPCFVGVYRFPQYHPEYLPETEYIEYEEWKIMHSDERLTDIEKKGTTDKYRHRCAKAVHSLHEKGWSYRELAPIFGVSHHVIGQLNKEFKRRF